MDKIMYINDDFPSLPFFEIDPLNFFNKTTVIYGAPKTGKSMIIQAVAYVMKDYIPNPLVISPTDSSSQRYAERVPPGCIHKYVTIDLLKGIVQRQKVEMKRYRIVNDIKNLKLMFDKIDRTRWEDEMYNHIIRCKNQRLQMINQDENILPIDKLETKRLMNDFVNKRLIQLYKQAIGRFEWHKKKLSKTEKLIIQYLHHNPFMMLIMDDVSNQMRDKEIKKILLEIFSTVRWLGMSIVVALHGDTNILPELRTIAFTSIFTDENSAQVFFRRTNNGIGTKQKKIIMEIIDILYRFGKGKTHFKKFVYTKERLSVGDSQWSQFHYAFVNNYDDDDFRMGSEILWELCSQSSIKLEEDEFIFKGII